VVSIIDVDTHLFERRSMWADHLPHDRRHLALRIVDDELGYSWLAAADGRRIHLAEVHTPGDVATMGRRRERQRRGLPPEVRFDDLPAHDHEPATRVALMDDHGVDEAVVFPNFGLFFVRALEDQPEAQLANMEAWNRWAIEGIGPGSGGRLHPVGHVSLRDPAWLEAELGRLADAGVTAAMVPIGPVDGRRLSDPDLDRCWRAFEDLGVAVVFHVADGPRPFDDAWYEGDVNPVEPMLMSTFISVPPMLALTDLAAGGVLARHPGLRVGLVEFTASWFAPFLRSLDACARFHADYNGLAAPGTEGGTGGEAPSTLLRRQVKVAAFGFEQPADLQAATGDLFMFGSDYPHAEGLARPVEDFAAGGGPDPSEATASLYHDNAAWLLGM